MLSNIFCGPLKQLPISWRVALSSPGEKGISKSLKTNQQLTRSAFLMGPEELKEWQWSESLHAEVRHTQLCSLDAHSTCYQWAKGWLLFMNLVVIDTWPCDIFKTGWKTGKLNSDVGDGDGRHLFSALRLLKHLL